MSFLVSVITLVMLLFTAQAWASGESDVLSYQGRLELRDGHNESALELFEQALSTDPSDIDAKVFRGLARLRVGDFVGSASDLRAVLSLKPTYKQAALELGIALIHLGNYGEAIEWLNQAQRAPLRRAETSLFLGIAHLRLGKLEVALRHFRRAAEDPGLEVSAEYYQALTAYRDGRWAEAEKLFAVVQSSNSKSELGREAGNALKHMRQAEQPRRAYEIHASSGFEYDSNVTLAPTDGELARAFNVKRQQDGRATITIGGSVPWRIGRTQVSIGYELFQSLHFDIQDFDLQDHRPTVQAIVNFDSFNFGILGRYDFYLLKESRFLQMATIIPWVEIPEGKLGHSELSYRLRWLDFFDQPFSEELDALNHQPGLRQFFYLDGPDRSINLGYRFDRNNATHNDGKHFSYSGHEVTGGIAWLWSGGLRTQLDYVYRHEGYSGKSRSRRDNEHRVVVTGEKKVTDHIALTVAYFGIIDQSTDPRFDYDRSIVSLSVDLTL